MSLIEYGYKKFVRPGLFASSSMDAEIAHEWGIDQLKKMQESPIRLRLADKMLGFYHTPLYNVVAGVPFRSPLGLAAGFDKYCEVFHTAIPACGFGFAEIGGITPLPQEGTKRTTDNPRLRRSELYQGLWNQMGFNNPGMDVAAERLRMNQSCDITIGANIGKGKDTPLDHAHEDYCKVIQALSPYVNFLVINVSTPNTKDVRLLQAKDFLSELAIRIDREVRLQKYLGAEAALPWGFKISPDESDEKVADIVDVSIAGGASFIVICNTTTSRDGLVGWDIPADRGGVSGLKLQERSRELLKAIYRKAEDRLAVISVGGINSAQELYDRILYGASLCQVYTAWPFEGPDMCKRWLRELLDRLRRDGFEKVGDAIGAYQ